MARKSKKRSAETPVEDLEDELGSPANRSRGVDTASDEVEDSIKHEEQEQGSTQEEVEDSVKQEEVASTREEENERQGENDNDEEDDEEQHKEEEDQEGDQPKEEEEEQQREEDEVQHDEGEDEDQQEGMNAAEAEQNDEDNDEDQEEEEGEDVRNTNDDEDRDDEQMRGEEEEEVEEEEVEEEEVEEEEVEEEERESPKFRKVNVEGRPAEAGVIKKVVVQNFMCHQKLTVNLCRNVNFIHGQNGSGKSAILAAIQICLGANAKRTHRARNLKDLVRKEAAGSNPNTCAKVSVTLLNGGEDAYKPELYGNEITVERTIHLRGGFNGYKLFNEEEKEVSRKKCDLDDMLDFLNIQVDNPVAILDQEEAKKFLTGKASDKYEFFMKATELQRINKAFAAIADRSDELEQQKSRLKDSLISKREMVKTLKKKVDEFQKVEELEKQRLEVEVDYAWAFFTERSEEYDEAAQRMELLKKKVDEKQKELTQAEEEASGANDTEEEKRIRDRMDELKNEAESQAQLKRDLEAEVKIAQNPVKQAQRKLKSLESDEKNAGKVLIRAQRRLKETREEIASKEGSAESEQARLTKKLNEVEDALSRAKADTPKINEGVTRAYRAYEEQQPEYEQAQQNVRGKDKQCYAVKSKLRELTASESNDPAAIFGRKCSEMVKLVEQARRKGLFKDQVIGPIGVFLKVAPGKEKYAEIAEAALGHGTLDRFIVTNDQDRKQFQKLREQLKCFKECGTFQTKPSRRFNIPPPPAPEIETIASVLSVSNDLVFNCLVDNNRIDQRALAPSKEISEEHLLINDNGRYKIKGIINEVAFLPKGDKWTVRNGNISLSCSDKKGGKRIGIDRTEAIKETEEEVRQLEGELKNLKAHEKDLHSRHIDLKKAWNQQQRAKRANHDEVEALTKEKAEIENELETTASNTSIDTTEMEDDVAAAEEALQKIADEKASVKDELEGLKPAVDDAKKRLEEVQTRNEKVLQDMKEAEDSLEACMQRQTQSDVKIQHKRNKVQKYEDQVKQYQPDVDRTANDRDHALATARKLTLRLKQKEERQQEEGEDDGSGEPQSASQAMSLDATEEELKQVEIRSVPKDAASYEAKLKRIKKNINKEKERRDLSNEDPQVAIEKWHRAKADLLETQNGYKQCEELYDETQKDLYERRKRWGKLRKYLEKITDSRFDNILRLNQACGELEFDDDSKQLNLVVQKNVNDPDSQTKDVKALSGGERSYTTISLLLALGESLETPFRVLDEFDVFLDPQARKLTIQTLIHVAKKMEHRQFIFITPQDLSSVTPEQKVKIFKLKPPERNQRAGGPTQQTLESSFSQE